MKKRVAILYSGQIRSNSLNPNYSTDNTILESTSNFLLNDEFKSKYEYDVFFSVDNININKVTAFFGDNLKNIHITETNFYLHPIENTISNYEYFYEKYLKTDFQGCLNHINALYQYYRLYCVYNLLYNYQLQTNTTYDYLIRIRPDSRIMQDIMPLFNILETTNTQIITEHEQLCIMKNSMKDLFKLIEYYGDYNKSVINNNMYNFLSRAELLNNDYIYKFCPEKQFIDHIYFILNNNNFNPTDSFIGIHYPSYTLLYREDGTYGYIDNSHTVYNNKPHIPFNDITYIKQKYNIKE